MFHTKLDIAGLAGAVQVAEARVIEMLKMI